VAAVFGEDYVLADIVGVIGDTLFCLVLQPSGKRTLSFFPRQRFNDDFPV
jgi:hypothetical protein